jgi:hypothetical protein
MAVSLGLVFPFVDVRDIAELQLRVMLAPQAAGSGLWRIHVAG